MNGKHSPSLKKEKSQLATASCPLTTPSAPMTPDQTALSSEKQSTTKPSLSLRDRRMQRTTNDKEFRPISVLTKNGVMQPFNFDAEDAFDHAHRRQQFRTLLKSAEKKPYNVTPFSDQRYSSSKTVTSNISLAAPLTPTKMAFDKTNVVNDSEMDIMSALKATSPEKDSPTQIHADFKVLSHLPTPDISEHPIFHSKPFKSISSAPALSTSSTAEEIREQVGRTSKSSDSTGYTSISSEALQSVDRKRGFLRPDSKTPSIKPKTSLRTLVESSSSLKTSKTSTKARIGLNSQSPSPRPLNVTPKESASSGSSIGGIRKFSDMFRSKTQSENSASPTSPTSPVMPLKSPNLNRQDLVGTFLSAGYHFVLILND